MITIEMNAKVNELNENIIFSGRRFGTETTIIF
jgi:hypothetical protein